MKLSLCILALPALLLVGCGEKSGSASTATNAPSGSAVTAPVDHLKSAVKAQQDMVKTVDLSALNKAIQLFNVQEGRLPKNLEELVEKKYIGEMPWPPAGSKISYNATKGTVTIEKL